jgi:hypothetical protein
MNERTAYSPDLRIGSAPLVMYPFWDASNFPALFSKKLIELEMQKLYVRIVIHGMNFTQEPHNFLFRTINPDWLEQEVI